MLGLYGRPHDWSWLLTFHLFGAFVLIGAALTVSVVSLAALRQTAADRVTLLRRAALRTNLLAFIPALIVVYVFGAWLASKEHLDKNTPTWLDLAFRLTDMAVVVGGILLSLLQWWVLRRARAGQLGGWQAQTASYLSPVVLTALLVVLFLMSGKPGN